MRFDEALKLRDAYRRQYPHMCKAIFSDGGYGPKPVHHLYDAPNGGKRILPSIYCKMKAIWFKSNSVGVAPADMNDGHLENTLKLLQESHGNVQARAQDLLGRMSYHYQNQPAIVKMLAEVCLAMQKVDVDDMYPIFIELNDEWHKRHTDHAHKLYGADADMMVSDDLLKGW